MNSKEDELRKKNALLEQELALKNRELGIEASLEKVRSRSLTVHKSDEFKEVIKVVFEQLQELGIAMTSASINIFIADSKDTEVYICGIGADGLSISNFRLSYFDHPIANDRYEAYKKGLDFFTKTYEAAEKNSFYEYEFAVSDLKNIPHDIKKMVMESKRYTMSLALNKNSMIVINDFEGKTLGQKQTEIVKKFSRVFEQAYIRFLDLKKAEAQAREAEIQLALERVRARTLAMHNSSELAETAGVLCQQFINLGISPKRCLIGIMDKKNQSCEFFYTGFDGKVIPTPDLVPMNEQENLKQLYNAWLENKDHLYFKLVGQQRVNWTTYVMNKAKMHFPEYEPGKIDLKQISSVPAVFNTFFFAQGFIMLHTIDEIPKSEIPMLKRFSGVFEQTYTRFLDLQKAEAQTRKAQIELSLERVRAKAMAMQKSDDLSEAVAIIFDELDNLNLGMLRCGIGILDKEKCSANVWTATKSEKGSVAQVSGDEPMNIHPLLQGAFDAWLDQRQDYAYVLEGEDLNRFYAALTATNFQLPGSQTFSGNLHELRQYYYVTTFVSGGLYAFRNEPFSDEAKMVMKRFADVFNFTYTRFGDLKQAEAQAYEARVEAALERVRTAAMAMHSSEGLLQVTQVLREQMALLGQKELESIIIHIYNEKADCLEAWYSYRHPNDPTRAVINGRTIVEWDKTARTREDKKQYHGSKQDYTIVADHEMLQEWYEFLFKKIPEVVELSDDGKIIVPDVLYYNYSKISGGALLLITNSEASPQSKDLLNRAAKVFNLAYSRFLDLQKAEAQAREGQIQLALERVRARTMAMQKSEELAEVSELLFKQVSDLGIKTWATGFNVWSEDNNSYEDWITSPRGGLIEPYIVDATRFSTFIELSDARKSGQEFYIQYVQGEKLKQTYDELLKFGNKQQFEKLPGDDFKFPTEQYLHMVFGSKVSLMFITYQPVPEAHDIFKRFAKVFEQTYTRFLDLQKAEAQALEAIKRASVDRVRAEIASMRTTSDLERITPLIWNELTTLGVPFIRCGIFIMDDENQQMQSFLSTPNGKAIAAFRQSYNASAVTAQIVSSWHKKEIYKQHWSETQFIEFIQDLVQQGAITSGENYLTENHPANLYLHFLPFLQGMLYVGNTAPLNDEALQLVQNLADAFSTAYARYEDFNKLEAAKKQVDSTLNELQATQKQLIQSEKMASLGELTAGIAHEIQNPLNFVNNFSEVNGELIEELKIKNEKLKIEDDEVKELINDIKQNLEKINHHGKRADAIVKGMLQHSRKSEGKKEPTDINALCDEYLRLSYHGLRAKDKSFNAEIKTDFDETIGKINIVRQDIGRVLLNLFNNAFYAVNEKKKTAGETYKPTITVRTKGSLFTRGEGRGEVIISVSDNGNGIPQNIIEKIFQPFFTTKPTGQGTGLGLSLAYDIITKGHDGELQVQTKEGEGSEFVIQLQMSS